MSEGPAAGIMKLRRYIPEQRPCPDCGIPRLLVHSELL